MPEREGKRVAVLGAAGFLGRSLLHALEERDLRVTPVVRGPPELSVDGAFHAATDSFAALTEVPFDTVINLAYPNSGPPFEHPAQNAAIVRTVNGLLKDRGHLIHVSTQAVFGLALDRPVHPRPVPAVRDAAYVESKIAAEHAFSREQAARGLSVDIVRLGNIFGAASGAWGVSLVQRLLTGRPVGVRGHFGPSNTTDVANAASYLTHLLQQSGSEAGVVYHHLAEFSGVSWKDWVEPIADAVGVAPVYADPSVLRLPASGREELAEALSTYRPRIFYRRLIGERILGSWSRTFVRSLPAPMFARAKGPDLVFATEPPLDRAEQTFLAIMAGEQEFKSVVRPDWSPLLSREQSLARFLEWLRRN